MSYSNTASDTQFAVYKTGDATAQMKFALAAIAPSTTRTLTLPDTNVTLSYIPSGQTVNAASTPQFAKVGINQPAGTEALEVNGTAKVVTAGGLTIGTHIPSAAQWGYLAAADQALTTSSTATFASATASTALKVTETGGGSDTIEIKAPAALASNYTLTFPANAGAATQVLATNGSNTTYWTPNLGGNTNFADGSFNIYKVGDATAQMKFDAAAVSPATTRTITIPNANVDLDYVPNQPLLTTSTPQFTKLGINQAAGTETLEINGTMVVSTAGGMTVSTSTPSATQLGYLTALDQGLSTSSATAFAKVALSVGAETTPSLYCVDANTGFYESGANVIGVSGNGAKIADISADLSMATSATLQAGDGTAAAPSIAFTSDTNTGIYRGAANELAISIGGTKKVAVGASKTTINGVALEEGTVSTKFYTDAEYTIHRTTNWEMASMGTTSTAWRGLAYGGSTPLFAAVSSTLFASSTNAFSWDTISAPNANSWCSICYDSTPAVFVAVASTSASGAQVATSADSVTWTTRTAAAALAWSSVAYGASTFVAVASSGSGNRVMTSADGTTWQTQTSAFDNDWSSVCFGGGLFVAVSTSGSSNRVMTSPDSVTWSTQSTPAAADLTWNCVCYSADLGMYCAVASSGTGSRIMTSTTGTTWATRAAPFDLDYVSVVWGDGLFLAIANATPAVIYSQDGISWYAADTQGLSIVAPRCLCYGASADAFSMISDATGTQSCWANWPDVCNQYARVVDHCLGNWAQIPQAVTTLNSGGSYGAVCYWPYIGQFYNFSITGVSEGCRISYDGCNWVTTAFTTYSLHQSMCYSPTLALLCAVTTGGSLETSPSSISWTQRTSGVATNLNKVEWIAFLSLFNVLTTDKSIYSSTGVTWTTVSMGSTSVAWLDSAYSMRVQKIVAVANGNLAYSSTATSWTTQAQTGNFQNIAFSPELNLFCAPANGASYCLTSSDGVTWSRVNTNVTFGDYARCTIWVSKFAVFVHATGTGKQVLWSRDCKYWHAVTPTPTPTTYIAYPCFSKDHNKIICMSGSGIVYQSGALCKTITV